MHWTVAYASDDATLADWLAGIWQTRTNDKGERETFDPSSGVWQNDTDLVRAARAREQRRAIIGNNDIARQMNREGL